MDAILEPLLRSSHLPTYVAQLNRVLLLEEQKRRDFYEWLDEDKRAEFVQGELIMHSPARLAHIIALQNLQLLLVAHVRYNDLGLMLSEQALIRFERSDLMPDIAYWPKTVSDAFDPDTKLFPVPLFVIEILSPSTEKYDRGKKMDEYAANGVLEYWIVSPDEKTVEQYELRDEEYLLKGKHGEGMIRCIVLAGHEIAVTDIFKTGGR